MNKKKKDFFQELRDRNVWREIKAYLFGGATIIPLVFVLQPIVGYSNEVGIIIFIIFFSLFPSVFLFAYHHGESREAPWSKSEMIGIPANILITLFLVIFFYNNSVIASETTTELIKNVETGELEEIEVVKKEFREKLYLSFFENNSNDTTLDWLEYAFPTAIRADLQQDKYITPWGYSTRQIEEKNDSYKYGDKISSMTYLQIARERLIPYFIEGSFTKINDKFEVTTSLWITKTGKVLTEKTFQNNNFFKLIDELSISIKEDLGLSKEYIENAEDFPVSAYLTESLLAYEYYIRSRTYHFTNESKSFLDSDQLQKQVNLLNKAIAIDQNFVLAYSSCLWKYDRMPNRQDSTNLYWKKVMQKIHRAQEKTQYWLRYNYLKKQGKMAEGVKLLKNWARKYPDDKDPHSALASYYNRNNDFVNALDQYKKILSIDETDYDYYSSISWVYSNMNDFNNAIKWRKKLAIVYSEDSDYFVRLASLYSRIRQIDSAIFYYKEAITIDPSDLRINTSLHDLEIEASGKLHDAINNEHLLEYAQNLEDSVGIGYSSIYTYMRLGQLKKYTALNDSIEKLDVDRWLGWGIPEWEELGKEEEAYTILLATGKKDKLNKQIQKRRDVMSKLASSQKYGESVQGIVDMWIKFNLSNIYLDELYGREHIEEIKKHTEIVKKMDEEDTKKQTAIIIFSGENITIVTLEAKIHMLNNEYNKAIALLEEHKHIDSYDSYIIQLARYYHRVKNYKKAEENFNLVFTTDPYDPELNYYASLLYHDWGKKEKAIEHLNISLEIWKNADKDHVLANKVKEAAQEWKEGILN